MLENIDEAPRIDAIKKNINTVEKITNEQIVLYYSEITRYRRKSLIQINLWILQDSQHPFYSKYGYEKGKKLYQISPYI